MDRNNMPRVTGPIKGGVHGWPYGGYFGDLKKFGYVEEEYFLEGNAVHYEPEGELGDDGKWVLKERKTTAYKTRLLVRRPLDKEKFNGTVVMEWSNVSFGMEISLCDGDELYEQGFAYVLVLTQPTGLNGYARKRTGLKDWDPERYGELYIDSDGASYDIFTQAARCLRNSGKNGVMGGLEVKHVIATGASQSGTRLQAYANGVHVLSKAFDGYIPIVHGWNSADFCDEPAHPDPTMGNKGHSRHVVCGVREDLDALLLGILTQTESVTLTREKLGGDTTILWEVAGASHIGGPHWLQINRRTDRDGLTDTIHAYEKDLTDQVDWIPTYVCGVCQLHGLFTEGTPVKTYPRIERLNGEYVRDEFKNVKGGIRLPELEVPVAWYEAGPDFRHGGFTIPFSEEQLKKLYPTHEEYVEKISRAAEAALKQGVITENRMKEYIAAAEAAPVPVRPMPSLKPEGRR